MSLIKLLVNGISYSQTQTGAYALILSEQAGADDDDNNRRKLPIIIAKTEAQAIALALEKDIEISRPMTHDLFKDFATKFGIIVREVIIHKLKDGVFHSSIVCKQGTREVVIDSRTSDAVALALRFDAPIFTYKGILDQAGVNLSMEQEGESMNESKEESSTHLYNNEEIEEDEENLSGDDSTEDNAFEYSSLEKEALNQLLDDAIEHEDYEKAANLRDEIERRNESD
ncbi:MAG: bifunctional nuclease family protein [Ichthyobacteriaceae bacterium]|nr:bifunctional nuclease family protein [Ichthyobacteriaceae bacterium]